MFLPSYHFSTFSIEATESVDIFVNWFVSVSQNVHLLAALWIVESGLFEKVKHSHNPSKGHRFAGECLNVMR